MEVGCLIIGGGMIGLATARSIAKRNIGRSVMLVERHFKCNWETSSRSSEVIHASVYYPPNSLKAKLCSFGNELMYKLCSKHSIPHKKTGKLIVATTDEGVRALPVFFRNAILSGGKDLGKYNTNDLLNIFRKFNAKYMN